jgi:hypothetical protein
VRSNATETREQYGLLASGAMSPRLSNALLGRRDGPCSPYPHNAVSSRETGFEGYEQTCGHEQLGWGCAQAQSSSFTARHEQAIRHSIRYYENYPAPA